VEFKALNGAVFSGSIGVDIGTEWNLKSISEVDGKVEIALI